MKKNRKIKYTVLAALTCFVTIGLSNASAQVGMTNNDAHKSAALDLNATNKGLLIPRVSLASLTDKASIIGNNPAVSLMVYNTNTGLTGGTGYFYWDGSAWKKLGDDLGNHSAGQNLVMNNFSITGATNVTASGTVTTANAAVTAKTTTQTAAITKGTDGSSPATNSIAVAVDNNGNIGWRAPNEWSLTGNTGTIPGTNYIGTADSKDLQIRTAATTRMTITSAGNVGIGSTSPSAPLTVQSSSAGAVKIQDGTQGLGKVLTSDANGVATWQTKAAQAFEGSKADFTADINLTDNAFHYIGYSAVVPPGLSTINIGVALSSNAQAYISLSLSMSKTVKQDPGGLTFTPYYVGFPSLVSPSMGQGTFYINNSTGSPMTLYVWGALGNSPASSGKILKNFGENFILVAY